MSTTIKCKTLLGKRGLNFSITCLQSFVNHAEQEIHLEVFEDGSLTDDDVNEILSKIPNCTVIKKADREKLIKENLSNYPNCEKYRQITAFAQKLFDIPLYDNENIFYIDSDILFLKKFKLPEFSNIPVFMSDTFNAYSFTPKEFIKIKFPIFPYINSGFFYFPRTLYNLNYVEKLMQNQTLLSCLTEMLLWSEQTLWAFLAAQSKHINYFNRIQIVMAQQVMKIPVLDNIDDKIIAVHLVSSLRNHVFPELQSNIDKLKDAENSCNQIGLERDTGCLNNISFAIDRIKKKWRQMNPKKYSNYKVNAMR